MILIIDDFSNSATAEKIVAYRQAHGLFTSVDGLDAIPGIGPARLADLRPLVVP
jgi:competence protein ComEA